MESHETGKVAVDKTEATKAKKGSFLSRLFGGSKAKKEEDPN